MKKDYVFLHLTMLLMSFTGVISKFAAQYEFLSLPFILCYGSLIFVLGIYAVLWQQILKKIDLSVAYANKSIVTIWGLIWSVIFFNEIITFKTIIATIFIIIGIIFFNKEEKQ